MLKIMKVIHGTATLIFFPKRKKRGSLWQRMWKSIMIYNGANAIVYFLKKKYTVSFKELIEMT